MNEENKSVDAQNEVEEELTEAELLKMLGATSIELDSPTKVKNYGYLQDMLFSTEHK